MLSDLHPDLRPARTRGRVLAAATASIVLAGSVGFAATVAASAASPAPRAAAPRSGGSSGSVMKFWAPVYMTRKPSFTLAQAVEDATKYDVLVAQDFAYKGYADEMHKANSSLRIYAYMNGTFAQGSEGTRYPDSWYAKTASGQKIHALLWGNYLMDPTNPGWIADRVAHCKEMLAATKYDGCGVDMITPVAIGHGFVDGVPINPRTKKPWTDSDYYAAAINIAVQIKKGSGKPLFINGVGDGPSYFDKALPEKQALAQVDGAIAEVFLRVGRAPVSSGPTEDKWRQNVDMLVDAERSGRQVIADTKTWTTAPQAAKDQWHRFGLASFMLGANGRSRYYFTYTDPADQTVFHPWWTHDPGAPTGAYGKTAGGYYERTFAHGLVVANPTTKTVTVKLPRPMVTLAGKTVTSVTLAKWDGEVLVG